MSERYRANADQIRKYLPHRAPFLLVDRIIEIDFKGKIGDLSSENNIGTRVLALKNVTYNEPFMPGHFPQMSIMPGVLILEALAQTACLSCFPHVEDKPEQFAEKFHCILAGIDGGRFRRPVVPGDSLMLQTTVKKIRNSLWVFSAEAKVDGQLVTEAEIMANLMPAGGRL